VTVPAVPLTRIVRLDAGPATAVIWPDTGEKEEREEGSDHDHGPPATLATDGGRPAHLDRGWFVEPTIFSNVDNSLKIAREEIFGPVLSVIPANDKADAVRIANDTSYGLNASVFTPDPERALAVARQLRSGTVGHNAFRSDFDVSFGGFKQSGIGREGGRDGLVPYLETKYVILDGVPARR
jgi:acyl-CoA reductase-like NAD-dependent aldehyde dehydrogenase